MAQLEVDRGFAAYVRGRQTHLLRIAVLLTGDLHQAEDLLQDALVKLSRHWSRVADEQPDAYVRRILYRDNITRWHRGRREVVTDAVPDRTVLGPRWEARVDVRVALQQLPPRQRAVLVLRYFEDLTEVETARVMDTSVGTVKKQAYDALRRMRELLGPEWGTGRGEGR